MKKLLNKYFNASLLFVCLLLVNCAVTQKPSPDDLTLKDAYKKYFLIGTALSEDQINEKDPTTVKLIAEQFNAATPENIMKSMYMHPAWTGTISDLQISWWN